MQKVNFTNEAELKKSNLWQDAERIISFDTVSSKSNIQCSDSVANQLESLGFTVVRVDEAGDKQQILAYIGPEEPDGLILSGHMDIVPFDNQPGWTKDPLNLKLENEKLYGRGTSDMKLFIPHCLEAFRSMDLKKLKKPIVCIFTCDEEVGCLGAKSLSPKLNKLTNNLPLPTNALIGEPTGFQIINAHKGVTMFELTIKGLGGHSSRPDLGINAILPTEKVIKTVKELNEFYINNADLKSQELFPEYPNNFLTLVQIKGGLAFNMIPDECVLSFSYRSLPTDDPHRVYDDFKTQIEKLNLEEKINFKKLISVPSLSPTTSDEFESMLMQTVRSDKMKAVSFATDAAYFAKENISCYVCGAGSIDMAHKPNEYMTLDDFLLGPGFVESILRKTVF